MGYGDWIGPPPQRSKVSAAPLEMPSSTSTRTKVRSRNRPPTDPNIRCDIVDPANAHDRRLPCEGTHWTAAGMAVRCIKREPDGRACAGKWPYGGAGIRYVVGSRHRPALTRGNDDSPSARLFYRVFYREGWYGV